MATVALWHLGLTAVLAAVLLTVMVLQSLSQLVRGRLARRGVRRAVSVTVPVQARPTVEPRMIDAEDAPGGGSVTTMTSAAAAH